MGESDIIIEKSERIIPAIILNSNVVVKGLEVCLQNTTNSRMICIQAENKMFALTDDNEILLRPLQTGKKIHSSPKYSLKSVVTFSSRKSYRLLARAKNSRNIVR